MTTHIKNAEYRRFWEAQFQHALNCQRVLLVDAYIPSGHFADKAAAIWASRFADPETLADIEANEMKRGQG